MKWRDGGKVPPMDTLIDPGTVLRVISRAKAVLLSRARLKSNRGQRRGNGSAMPQSKRKSSRRPSGSMERVTGNITACDA